MTQLLFRNLDLLDPHWDSPRGGYEVLVEGDTIREVSDKPIKAAGASVIDCGRRVLMPGLIDSHVHVYLSEVYIRRLEEVPLTLMTARATEICRNMLARGFTTVRDTGGADWGIKIALESGLIAGPRLFIAGRAIGPTSGHSDARRRTDLGAPCKCCNAMAFCMEIADGADQVRKAAREQIRQGADQIKIMVSGGVASPYDPLDSRQYTLDEIAAAVEEATAFGKYTQAHAYTPDAIQRAIGQGVRTIEHGNLIDDASAKMMASKGAYLVANLVAYYAMKERAQEFGMGADMLAKNDMVIDGGLKSLEICKRAGVKVGLRQRPAGPADGRPEPRVPAAQRSAVADRDRAPGDAGRRRDRAHGGQARRGGARRLRRSHRRRRRSAQEPGPVPGAGRASLGDHEGRQVLQEQADLIPWRRSPTRGAWDAGRSTPSRGSRWRISSRRWWR
jgi:imidazolonepropionase-like amidohydrolase